MSDLHQFGFDGLLGAAHTENRARKFERETADLPGTMDEALPFFCGLLSRHNRAMRAADIDETLRLREEAHRLARKLNGWEGGILADENAPGRVLEATTIAKPGTVPIWGQKGSFAITVRGVCVRIKLDGVFGIGSGWGFWPGFSAHAVDHDRPFISATGYRSFLGVHADPCPDLTPDAFTIDMVTAYLDRECGGKLVRIDPQYRKAAA